MASPQYRGPWERVRRERRPQGEGFRLGPALTPAGGRAAVTRCYGL
jgi:hypothetical protein